MTRHAAPEEDRGPPRHDHKHHATAQPKLVRQAVKADALLQNEAYDTGCRLNSVEAWHFLPLMRQLLHLAIIREGSLDDIVRDAERYPVQLGPGLLPTGVDYNALKALE